MSDGMYYGQSERSMWFAEIATLRADLAKAREERDEHLAARVRAGHRHDEDLRILDGERRRAEAAERVRDEAVAALREAAELLREDAKEHHRPNGWTKAADWNEKKAAEWDALISRVLAASTGEAK